MPKALRHRRFMRRLAICSVVFFEAYAKFSVSPIYVSPSAGIYKCKRQRSRRKSTSTKTMEKNNNQNTDWFEIGGVTAYGSYTDYGYCPKVYGILYVRKIFDQFYYKFKNEEEEKECVVIKNTNSNNSSRNAYILGERDKYYFDVPRW